MAALIQLAATRPRPDQRTVARARSAGAVARTVAWSNMGYPGGRSVTGWAAAVTSGHRVPPAAPGSPVRANAAQTARIFRPSLSISVQGAPASIGASRQAASLQEKGQLDRVAVAEAGVGPVP